MYGQGVRAKMDAFKSKHQKPSQDSGTPYHGMLHMQEISGHDDQHGRPEAGSRTEFRGKSAGVHVTREIIELCEIIEASGSPQHDGTIGITFGALFEIYTKISNKLVGMLLRARKQDLVSFEGEMLFQRRDDDVVIYLLKLPEELLQDMEIRKEELKHHNAAVK